MPMRHRQKMAEDLDIGMWNFYGALYGPEPIMDNNWKVLEEAFRSIPGAKFYFEGDRPNDPAWRYRVKLMRGEPNMTEFSLMNWVGSGGAYRFLAAVTVTGEDSMKQFTMIRDRANEYGFDYIGEFLVGWRELLNIFQLVFDRLDDDERRRAHECFGLLVTDFAEQGYGEYRTHLNFMTRLPAPTTGTTGRCGNYTIESSRRSTRMVFCHRAERHLAVIGRIESMLSVYSAAKYIVAILLLLLAGCGADEVPGQVRRRSGRSPWR